MHDIFHFPFIVFTLVVRNNRMIQFSYYTTICDWRPRPSAPDLMHIRDYIRVL